MCMCAYFVCVCVVVSTCSSCDRAGDIVKLVECMPDMYKALGLIPDTAYINHGGNACLLF